MREVQARRLAYLKFDSFAYTAYISYDRMVLRYISAYTPSYKAILSLLIIVHSAHY